MPTWELNKPGIRQLVGEPFCCPHWTQVTVNMQHESWALDLPYSGQELVSAGVTAEVFAQSLIDIVVHRPRAFDHDINVQRRASWVAKL